MFDRLTVGPDRLTGCYTARVTLADTHATIVVRQKADEEWGAFLARLTATTTHATQTPAA
jgi:hypothetical protein